jgi:hypothetical protein
MRAQGKQQDQRDGHADEVEQNRAHGLGSGVLVADASAMRRGPVRCRKFVAITLLPPS